MAKPNGKAKKTYRPLLSDRKLPQVKHPHDGTSFELSLLPMPVLERESDVAEYLMHELPEWIDAVDSVVVRERGFSLESSLMWDLRNLVCLIGCALAEGQAPCVERSFDNCDQSLTVEAVARCLGESPDDALRFLRLLSADGVAAAEG